MESKSTTAIDKDEVHELLSESAESDHSFEHYQELKGKPIQYTTTNLITQSNLKLSDIKLEKYNQQEIKKKCSDYIMRNCFTFKSWISIDPR